MRSDEHGESSFAGFHVLPEGCTAKVLSLTTPGDVCRLSLVDKTFLSAAKSDAVWERFLPSDYENIIARSVTPSPTVFSFKRDLYIHLCDHPLLIDGGSKSFSLEKFSGKKCYMLAARNLKIVWADTPQYWTWTSLPESRFAEVAELHVVWWLEICGKIDTCILSPNTTYEAYLVFKLAREAYGFHHPPSEVSVGIVGDKSETQYVYLDRSTRRESGVQYPKERGDGWLEIKLGEFVNHRGEDGELEMTLMEVKGGVGKEGLIVEGIEIRPKRPN
uniref:Putative F-box protein PP2-B10-like n=1 Tax=Davidia involucrata TaxID=16924 RepID=A0A5B7BLX5_DAVIN